MKISHIGILFGLIGLGGAIPTFASSSSICDAVSSDLILNCGFETGDFTDWTVTDAATSTDLENTLNIPNSGTHDARFGAGGGENDLLDQTFATTSGDSYTVSFYVDSGAGVSANGQFIADWNGGNILTITGASWHGHRARYRWVRVLYIHRDRHFGHHGPRVRWQHEEQLLPSGRRGCYSEPHYVCGPRAFLHLFRGGGIVWHFADGTPLHGEARSAVTS